MTKSEQIRALAKKGIATADIARLLEIRYQHAYNVLRQSGGAVSSRSDSNRSMIATSKPALLDSRLFSAGFEAYGYWRRATPTGIELSEKLPKHQGVYAFAIDGIVQYVGVATMGLAKRVYFYAKPGISQKTSIRINKIINECVANSIVVQMLAASPGDLEWNGLPVHGCAGLELGLIKAFDLPWNQRSSS